VPNESSGLHEFVSQPSTEGSGEGITKVLHAIRTHLQMDVAFVSEFRHPVRVFQHVDAAGRTPIQEGDSAPLDQGYCQKVVDGRLPELIPDAHRLPETACLPETQAIPIGAHLSVPIRLRDGRVYGTFCCFSYLPDYTLTERDLQTMRVFAELVADRIDKDLEAQRERDTVIRQLDEVMASGQPTMVFQPIYDVTTRRMTGAEALSRFHSKPLRSPDLWFRDAATVGLGIDLERRAVSSALQALAHLPADAYVAVNASPYVVESGVLEPLLCNVDARRLMLEITEHVSVGDYARLGEALAPLRALGVKVAIDDAGAGYASMRHILSIEPDLIKLDMSLTRGVDQDRKRRALASALIAFAHETGADIVAEGVETAGELNTLCDLGVRKVQGYFLSRPQFLADVAHCLTMPQSVSDCPSILVAKVTRT
jgi:EAL domain-containing protein (putative c-di-GMP-specific phosphodiesterase class I)